MQIKRILIISLVILISTTTVFALRYTSPNYTLSHPRIAVSAGKSSSLNYTLNKVKIGRMLSGRAESTNYSLDARDIDKRIIPSAPNPPTLNPLITPTSLPVQILSGTKDEDTSIYINGYLAVPIDSLTTWRCEQGLDEGENYLLITSRNRHGSESDSVLVYIFLDTSAPTKPEVVDDGAVTASTTQLHAAWSSSDPQTAIVEYQYAIGSSAEATDVVDWTSVGTQSEVTHIGLSLIQGETYYISVKAKNACGSWSEVGCSDGITVNQTIPAIISIHPADKSWGYLDDEIIFSVNAQDPDGDTLLYQFSVDGQIAQPWQASPSFNWSTSQASLGIHIIKVEVTDNHGGIASQEVELCLFRKPPQPVL